MQGLGDEHGSKVVQGGALAGSPFRQLSEEQLRKAAKRYPSDPRLQKFAKAKIAMMDLEPSQDPLPCAPLRLPAVQPQVEQPGVNRFSCRFVVKWLLYLLTKSCWRYVLWVLVFALLLKPAVTSVLAKYAVRLFRTFLRQLLSFLADKDARIS